MAYGNRHHCNELCRCPIHEIPLIYSEHYNDHACSDISCVFATGMKKSRKTKVMNVHLPELEE